MDKLVGLIHDFLKDRATSPLYRTFIFLSAVFHWEFIYTALFVDEGIILTNLHLLKNDYLLERFFNFFSFGFWFYFFLPFVFTWLVIYIFPFYLEIPAFRRAERDRKSKAEIRITIEKELDAVRTKALKVITERIHQEEAAIRAQKEIEVLDPTVSWRAEYDVFKESSLYPKFQYILESIYERQGHIRIEEFGGVRFEIPKEILAYCHVNDLIELNDPKDRIELTPKGKFYLRQASYK